jgi:hypothetical protein
MKGLILSTSLAAALGAFAFAPASAAPIATHGTILAPVVATDVACRTVKKTVWSRGVKRVTTSRTCDRPRYVERRVYHRDRRYGYSRPYVRPGVSIGIGVR